MEKTDFFVCRCHDVSHLLVLETLETEEDEERVVYGSFHLVHLEFWDKLKSATKCRYVCPLSPATSYTDSIAPPSTYSVTAPATATSTPSSSCRQMLRSFIVW